MKSTRPLVILAVLISALTAVGLWVAVPLVKGLIFEYGVKDDRAQVAWRTVTPEFGDANGCARCHATQHDALHTAMHTTIGCQSCHGALNEHEIDPSVGVITPSSAVCVRCHTQAQGQPEWLHTVVLKKHYTDACLACHNPHTSTANHPPVVSHKIIDIPTCITCHGPDKFRHQSIRHPDVTGSTDDTCLECHAVGSGPGMEDTNG